ncbi:hypothetical protein DES52_103162 [Deinococcus yavapaiensis KR-236]|uniref:Uncharacterized protein n=2 Tax=Deinococcus TaxID=1298 RepID=A0A318SLD6_9DEIO|nr:hypothetical protein DES52_103162 [Deinococcus yavapaiensis KR-236]
MSARTEAYRERMNTIARFQGQFALLPAPLKVVTIVLAVLVGVKFVLPLALHLVGVLLGFTVSAVLIGLPLAFLGWLAWQFFAPRR